MSDWIPSSSKGVMTVIFLLLVGLGFLMYGGATLAVYIIVIAFVLALAYAILVRVWKRVTTPNQRGDY